MGRRVVCADAVSRPPSCPWGERWGSRVRCADAMPPRGVLTRPSAWWAAAWCADAVSRSPSRLSSERVGSRVVC